MIQEATFGAGCFWCVEACFKDLKGIIDVFPGYTGGQTINPTYKEVCSGNTGHAEVARVIFDDTIVSYDQLLELFWFVHDPTQLNRQGGDIGTQYRSVVFYQSPEQKERAEFYMNQLTQDQVWSAPIVTEIAPISTFYKAEEYHFNYFALNPENPYCQSVVRPKVEKFKKVFADKLK
jgi:peptide-methionine (S)-S-oxide reductase